MKSRNKKTNRAGAALLVVLFIVMVITTLSVGFLARSDSELACGQNMILKARMDFLAESGLEHAAGLILNPQNVDSQYWQGEQGQQLVAGADDYYDVNVVKLSACNFSINCVAYREKDGQQTGRSELTAQLRLDPCIALWVGTDSVISNGSLVTGDVYCGGVLTNNDVNNVNGDVFCDGLIGDIGGQQMAAAELELAWPTITVADFTSNYAVLDIDVNSLPGQPIEPYDPVRVCRYTGDLELVGDVVIKNMLIVEGNLTVAGSGNVIRCVKNLPALFVTGDLIIEAGGELDIYGLAVVGGAVGVDSGAVGLNVTGGLFIAGGISDSGKIIVTAEPSDTAIIVWSAGESEPWGQACGAFFRSIER